ncbi:MAG: 30S ribosomal protein S16 [Legionella sp.]|nr:30S ribosomal protein S16 [Legionella sp.]
MVVIRLSRAGGKKRPFYNMVVTDSRKRRDGSCIERIGYFNPVARGQETRLHMVLERLTYWTGIGAKLSDRVSALVKEYKKNTKQESAA